MTLRHWVRVYGRFGRTLFLYPHSARAHEPLNMTEIPQFENSVNFTSAKWKFSVLCAVRPSPSIRRRKFCWILNSFSRGVLYNKKLCRKSWPCPTAGHSLHTVHIFLCNSAQFCLHTVQLSGHKFGTDWPIEVRYVLQLRALLNLYIYFLHISMRTFYIFYAYFLHISMRTFYIFMRTFYIFLRVLSKYFYA
jgi:hypothetical protein